jgi:hypothetical protein
LYRARWELRTAGEARGGLRPRTSSFEIYGKTHVRKTFCQGGKVDETHVVELITISSPVFVHDAFAIALVAKITALVFEVVFDLLLHIQVVEALHDFKQAVCILK